MVGAVLALMLSAPPSHEVAVLVSSERRVAPDVLRTVVTQLNTALTAEHIATVAPAALKDALAAVGGVEAAKRCQGAATCITRFAAALGPGAVVVSVDVGKLGKTLTLQLDAVGHDGAVLASTGLSVPANRPALATPFAGFAVSLGQRLAALSPAVTPPPPPPPDVKPPPSDAPHATVLVTGPDAQPSPGVQLSTRRPSPLPWVLGGAAVASLAVSVVFAILGASARAAWDKSLVPDAGRFGTSLTPSQANALAATLNTDATVTLITGIAAGAFGTGALITALSR